MKEGCKGPKLLRLLARHTGIKVPLRTLQWYVAEDCLRSIMDGMPGELEVDFLLLREFMDETFGQMLKTHALLRMSDVRSRQR